MKTTIKNASYEYFSPKKGNKRSFSDSLDCFPQFRFDTPFYLVKDQGHKSPIDEQLNEIEYIPHQHYLFFLNICHSPIYKFALLENSEGTLSLVPHCPFVVLPFTDLWDPTGIPSWRGDISFFLEDFLYNFTGFPEQRKS